MTEEALRRHLQGTDFTRQDFVDHAENFLIEAGAGAGKTTIMVDRIVNQLVSGYCQPEEIVAITFTNKSTLELRSKLDEQLTKRREALLARGSSRTAQEQTTLERLEYLIRESGRMQVSTIHSFCRTLLESMPFASPLGLDMQLLEDEAEEAKAFLSRRVREDYHLFREVRNMGMRLWMIEKFFLDRCNNNEAEIVFCSDEDKLDRWLQQDVPAAATIFHQKLLDLADTYAADVKKSFQIHYAIRSAMELPAVDFAANPDAQLRLTWLCLQDGEHCPLQSGLTSSQKSNFHKESLGMALDTLWTGKEAAALRRAAAPLVHSYLMRDLVPLLAEYRREKQQRHLATFNDLLLRARDMLRDSPTARTYFHRCYKVIYVDEMQDTDPIQTEMLFYLTTDEAHFNAQDWKQCRPVPGSLFLVGDPKQAIYRFRGADIGVYNILLTLFQSEEDFAANGADKNAVGRKVTLRFNFRSSQEICDLSDNIFRPETPAAPCHFIGGSYHAQYVSMEAKAGTCPRATLFRYYPDEARSAKDPQRVAAFIRTMIDQKIEVGIHDPDHKKYKHPARPGDFLILTSGKSAPQKYADALKALGIDSDVSGEKGFRSSSGFGKSLSIFERLALHLRSLLSPRDDRLIIRVLRECYSLETAQYKDDANGQPQKVSECLVEQLIHQLLLRTAKDTPGSRTASERVSLSGLLYPQQLAEIRTALEAENTADNAQLLKLCNALCEIAALRKLVKEKPAMAVIEHMLEGGYGIWPFGRMAPDERRTIYSEIQQYLNFLRSYKDRSFPALASYAIECLDKTYEHDLALEPTENVVRIMNLHKAKGLEGEIVILAYSTYNERSPKIHTERTGGGAREYVALHPSKAGFDANFAVAWPENWLTTQCPEEKKFLDAEYARLLYVAATRAKTMLVVYGQPAAQQSAPGSNEEEKLSYWQPIVEKLPALDPDKSPLADAYAALLSGQLKADAADDGADSDDTSSTPTPIFSCQIQPEELELSLQSTAAQLTGSEVFSISPSRLEHKARVIHTQQDEEDPDPNPPSDTGAPAPAQSEADEDAVVPDPDPTDPADPQYAPGPYGAAWGTIIHKVMELAVRSGNYSESALLPFARYAIHDALQQDLFDKKQRSFLGLDAEDCADAIFAKLVPQVVSAASFASDETCPLRCLLKDGVGYPEMPFFLQAKEEDDATGELYHHLMAHMKDEDGQSRTLAVEGIIDLAVLKDQCWYVVDYKTDKLHKGESESDFIQRLKEEYTPQITAYARVLEKSAGKSFPVKKAWLCSIPLGGALIELDI